MSSAGAVTRPRLFVRFYDDATHYLRARHFSVPAQIARKGEGGRRLDRRRSGNDGWQKN